MAICHRCGTLLPPNSPRDVCDECNRLLDAQAAQLPPPAADEYYTPHPVAASTTASPTVTMGLIAINVLVFGMMVFSGVSATNPSVEHMIRWGADYGPLTLSSEPWRMLSSAFLHVGMLHLLVNMWALWGLGAMAESLLGHRVFLLFYLLCAVGGSVLSLLVKAASVSAGASGAVFGVAGLLIALFYRGSFNVPRSVIQAQMKSLLGFTVFNLALGFIHPRINNSAHIGGLITGALLGLIVARAATRESRSRASIAAILMAVVLLAGGYYGARALQAGAASRTKAAMAFEERNYEVAIPELEALAREDPDDDEALAMLGWAYSATKQPEKSVSVLRRALEINPGNKQARNTLAVVYWTMKRWDEADAEFKTLAEAGVSRAVYGRGLVAAGRGDDPSAIQFYRTALEAEPGDPYISEQLGDAYMRLEQFEDALNVYRQAKGTPEGRKAEFDAKLGEAARLSRERNPRVE